MKKNKKMITMIGLIVVIVVVSGYWGVKYFLNKDLENAQKELEDTVERYGTVEKENVATTIAKFNKEVMDSGILYPAREDALIVQNETYWYGLYDDIALYIVASNFTNNQEQDITDMMAIYYDKNSQNEELVEKYVSSLIKANNENLTDAEIQYLIEEARNLSTDKKAANNGKGISVGLGEGEEHFEYQVIRLYK